ncbi:MAG: urease accessory protein UreE [Eubacteriales bacterium]|nr:urease accessory protein UreE [Eubacteriales bacterium]
MLCEKILGNCADDGFSGKTVDYVDIPWDEAFKKIHRKVSAAGREVGIRLDDSILTRGLSQGDVLGVEGDTVIAVNIPPCKAILIWVDPFHPQMAAKVCYEIGNRHASLFWGEKENSFITPYNEPMLLMLSKLPGVEAQVREVKLDFDRRISASINAHTH